MNKKIIPKNYQAFENIRRHTDEGREFWSARELAKVLQYLEYRNFLPVIIKAQKAGINNGKPTAYHFVHLHEMVTIGGGNE